MRERGMIFNSENVRAILKGSLTATRRPIKPQPDHRGVLEPAMAPGAGAHWNKWAIWREGRIKKIRCPYGKVGDLIYVRETFAKTGLGVPDEKTGKIHIAYRADGKIDRRVLVFEKWIPSIHMPKWASRIMLEITDVKVERVDDKPWVWIIEFKALGTI